MKPKPLSCLLMVVLSAVTSHALFAQCELPKPPGWHNLCNPAVNTTISNTVNTITITNPGVYPPDGWGGITISYYDEGLSRCIGPFSCPEVPITRSGNTITLTLNGCTPLPDFPTTAIFYINFATGGARYFYHVFNYSCDYVLPVYFSTFTAQRTIVNGVDAIRLRWTTDTEDRITHYIVEKGSAAGNAAMDMEIGRVDATDAPVPKVYEFVDFYPYNGTNWYRIRMVDDDGHYPAYTQVTPAGCDGCNRPVPLMDCSNIHIAGPSAICTPNTAIFELNTPNIFYNKYTWSPDPAGWLRADPSNLSKPYLFVEAYGDANTYISVSLSRCTQATRLKTRAVEAGKPFAGSLFSITSPSSPRIDLVDIFNGTNYIPPGEYWGFISSPLSVGEPAGLTVTSGNIFLQWTPDIQEIYLYVPFGGYGELQMDATTECGPKTYWISMQATAFAGYYSLSPNPASSQLNVFVDDRKLDQMKLKRGTDQSIQQVIIMDKAGNALFQQRYQANTRKISVNIAALKMDVYTIRIFNGKEWTAMKFIKQ